MVKTTAEILAFTGGEFSDLLQGRTDAPQYSGACKILKNAIASPQGPMIGRSGTALTCYASSQDADKPSKLIPYTLIDDDGIVLEFSHNIMRVIISAGLEATDDENITSVTANSPLTIIIAVDNSAVAGEQYAIEGANNSYGFTNRVFTVNSYVAGTKTITFVENVPTATIGVISGAALKRITTVSTIYTLSDVMKLRYQQNVDDVYLYCEGKRNQRVTRNSTTGVWSISEVEYNTGPFMPVPVNKGGYLTLASNGNPIPNMTSNNAPSGVVSSSTADASHPAWNAFDNNSNTYWLASGEDQKGWLKYQFPVAKIIVGYTIYAALKDLNLVAGETAKDHAPSDFVLEASNDDINWILLDKQTGYILYDNGRSAHINFNNSTAYLYYRFTISALIGSGALKAAVEQFNLTDVNESTRTINLTLTGPYDSINSGQGFLTTDDGRLIRLKGYDANWRVLKITTVTDSTHVSALLYDEPFVQLDGEIRQWQLGYFSDTLGWPGFGTFYENRRWIAGLKYVPALICGSRPGAYDDFAERTPLNEVLDDSALVLVLAQRKRATIRWISTDERGLIVGLGAGIIGIQSGSADSAITARNVKTRPSTERGVAAIAPAKLDRQHLYIPRAQRIIRELAFVFEADGYKAPNMSLFSSHLGASKFVEIQEQEEPYSLVWARRENNTMVCMTYYRDEKIVAWHQHDFGGEVESFCVTPDKINGEDKLVMSVIREGPTENKRFVVTLTPFWDFNKILEDAFYLDFGLRYEGVETDIISGLWHLEGETVNVLADGIPEKELVVTNGMITLRNPASNVVVGIGYEQLGVRVNLNTGSITGTSQSRIKRMSSGTLRVWDTANGECGIKVSETNEYFMEPIEYPESFRELSEPALFTGLTNTFGMPDNYDKEGIIAFRQTDPLPFNIVAFYPNLKGAE
jgi:hypothetical protein